MGLGTLFLVFTVIHLFIFNNLSDVFIVIQTQVKRFTSSGSAVAT